MYRSVNHIFPPGTMRSVENRLATWLEEQIKGEPEAVYYRRRGTLSLLFDPTELHITTQTTGKFQIHWNTAE